MEWFAHAPIAAKAGLSPAIIAELKAGKRPGGMAEDEAATYDFITELTTTKQVSDATFAELRQSLDNERLVDLVLTIAFYNAVVRILATLQIDVEDGYQKYLDEFPLPKD